MDFTFHHVILEQSRMLSEGFLRHKMKFINRTRLFCFVLFWTLVLGFMLSFFNTAKADIKENVVRLHIIANSDSALDQSIKLKVRDRILKDGKTIFSSSS